MIHIRDAVLHSLSALRLVAFIEIWHIVIRLAGVKQLHEAGVQQILVDPCSDPEGTVYQIKYLSSLSGIKF